VTGDTVSSFPLTEELFFAVGLLALLGVFNPKVQRAKRRNVIVESRWPTKEYLEYLSGPPFHYPASASAATFTAGHLPWMMSPNDRRKAKMVRQRQHDNGVKMLGSDKAGQVFVDPVHPVIASSPTRRTTQAPTRKEYPLIWARKNTTTVLGGIASALMQMAVAEVVFKERRPEDVARETGLRVGAIRSAVKRTRARILREFNKSNAINRPDPELQSSERGTKNEHEYETEQADDSRTCEVLG
jgi:hypothetical protein